MTFYPHAHYYTFATPPALPVPARRNKALDWQELTLSEQNAVDRFHRGECEVRDLPVRGQVFLRRHYGEQL